MPATADFLPWDSEFFGIRIARARIDGDASPASLANHCDAQGIDCTYLLVDAAQARVIADAQRAGFRVVDLRVTLDRPVAAPHPPGEAHPIRLALDADLPRLRAIARTAFEDTRFFRDGRFTPERCADLYDTWITKDCAGRAGAVLVSHGPAGTTGFVTCTKIAAETAQIGLIAVDAAARGQKTGGRLIAAAVRWTADAGCARTEVVTQGSNIPALRAYEAAGFRICRSEIWLHRWADEANATRR